MRLLHRYGVVLSLLFSAPVWAGEFTLSSTDISHGDFLPTAQEFKGFGCAGGNVSPNLSWQNAPEGTKSFAITVYDPDAPTGSGWWHWMVVNIPADVTELATGAGSVTSKQLPQGSMQMRNDYGAHAFGGACPPPGDGAHRYIFTVHALSVAKLDLTSDASAALAGYMINATSLANDSIVSLFKRD